MAFRERPQFTKALSEWRSGDGICCNGSEAADVVLTFCRMKTDTMKGDAGKNGRPVRQNAAFLFDLRRNWHEITFNCYINNAGLYCVFNSLPMMPGATMS